MKLDHLDLKSARDLRDLLWELDDKISILEIGSAVVALVAGVLAIVSLSSAYVALVSIGVFLGIFVIDCIVSEWTKQVEQRCDELFDVPTSSTTIKRVD